MPKSKHHHNALPHGYQINVYRIDHVIGQGGFGITYLAEDNLDRKVAIKEYLPSELAIRIKEDGRVHPISDDRADMYQWGLDRFLDEAKTLAVFIHPNIISILNFFEENGTAYAVMPYVDGDPLDRLIRQDQYTDEESLLGILMPILDGLELVHEQGLIHRDIKPANIFIRHDGSPILLDFGSARTAVGQQTRTLTAIVSPGYAPFEQYHGSGDKQGPWTDIYALGATLYAIINLGKGPIEATIRADLLLDGKEDPLQPAQQIGKERYSELFLSAIDDALKFRSADRPQTIKEWSELFHGTRSNRMSPQKPVSSETYIRTNRRGDNKKVPTRNSGNEKPSSLSRMKWGFAIALVLMLVIGTGTYYKLRQIKIENQQALKVEKLRQAEEARRIIEEKVRLEEEARRIAEAKRLVEQTRAAEERRIAGEKRKAEETVKRLAEQKRAAEERRIAGKKRKAEEMAKRLAEQKLIAKEKHKAKDISGAELDSSIHIKAPGMAEAGAVIPVTVSASGSFEKLWLMSFKDCRLMQLDNISGDALPYLSTRVKLDSGLQDISAYKINDLGASVSLPKTIQVVKDGGVECSYRNYTKFAGLTSLYNAIDNIRYNTDALYNGKKTIKIRAAHRDGITTVKSLVSHPMTNMRYIKGVGFYLNGRAVAYISTGPTTSKNPYFSIKIRGGSSGDKITMAWVDNNGGISVVNGTVK